MIETSSEVPEDYTDLKKNYLQLKIENENITQELHECKRNLKSMEFLQQEYQNEIDMLQSQEITQKQKYQEIIKQQERSMNNMRTSHNEEKQALENVIMKMEDKIETLKCEMNVDKEYNTSTHFNGDTSSLINEILCETPEYYENLELKNALSELMRTNESLEKKLQEYATEIENLKESFEFKRNELSEVNANIQALTDDNLCLKSELDSLKNQPLNKESKGNSLFAEVDDRRVYLQDKIKKMTSDYMTMVQEKAELRHSVKHLEMENLRLLEKWKKDLAEVDGDEDNILCSLKTRIKVLEQLIEKYKKDLAEKPVVISKKNFEEYEYFEMVLNEKNKEISSLRDELSRTSVSYMSFARELAEAHEQKRKWTLEAMTKGQELEIMKKSIDPSSTTEEVKSELDGKKDEVKMVESGKSDTNKNHLENSITFRNSKTPLKERCSDPGNNLSETEDFSLKEIKSCLKVGESSIEPVESRSIEQRESICVDKENAVSTRKVTFSQNTLSPKKTARRNCKVIISKPVKL